MELDFVCVAEAEAEETKTTDIASFAWNDFLLKPDREEKGQRKKKRLRASISFFPSGVLVFLTRNC